VSLLSFENRVKYPAAPVLFVAFIGLQLAGVLAFVR
jgi:hypothetical protein